MAFHPTDDIDSETASIHDVLMCWESGEDEDDDDSIHMLLPKIAEDLVVLPIVNVIPVSPRVISHVSAQGNCETLDRLLKKYPTFVPHGIPQVAAKRSRPVCTFINYLGTREPPKPIKKVAAKAKKVVSKSFKPSPYPTDAPIRVPQRVIKKPKLTATAFSVVTPTEPSKKKIFHASPMPTLCPTTTRYAVSPTF